jgi:exoribonuclease R
MFGTMNLLETKNYKQFSITNTNISFDDYHLANRCLPGDKVEWVNGKCILKERAEHRTLVGILEINSKYRYGHTGRNIPIYLFHPLDPAYPPMRIGCSERDTSQNRLCLVKFSDWTEMMPRGALIRLLGPVGDLESEKLALQWLYGKPEFKKLTFDIEPILTPRHCLFPKEIGGQTINIDPEGCKDIDDLVTLIPSSDGWDLYITIADVAEAIEEGSPGDILASQKGQTLYQNGKAVLPMLPSYLSEEQLSLLPGKERQGITLYCHWSNNKLTVKGFEEITVKNCNSYSYETIYTADFPVTVLKEIASHLKGEETNDSHEWIEQLMLLYNVEGAKILLKQNAGLIRTHKAADKEKLEQMDKIHSDLRIFAFEAAKYELTAPDKFHATLGNQPYTHLTSPLRRYADLVNQRVLKAYIRKESVNPVDPSLPSLLNLQQKKQKHHDRELFFLEKILQEPTGVQQGIVVESTDSKTKVYLPAWKRIVKVATDAISSSVTEQRTPGTEVTVEYYADLKRVSWKDRIVFRIQT